MRRSLAPPLMLLAMCILPTFAFAYPAVPLGVDDASGDTAIVQRE